MMMTRMNTKILSLFTTKYKKRQTKENKRRDTNLLFRDKFLFNDGFILRFSLTNIKSKVYAKHF